MITQLQLDSCYERCIAKPLHKCDNHQVTQVSVYDDQDIVLLRSIEQMPFLGLLNVPQEHLPLKIPNFNGQVTLDTFLNVANTLAKSMRDQCN
jgi:hypothetical protein